MQTLAKQLAFYSKYHTKRITKITHIIGIPCLTFAVMIFLGWIHLSVPNIFSINLAWIVLIALLIYYFILDIWLALGMTVILTLMTVITQFISQPEINKFGAITFLVFLIIGIVAQFIGHIYEKQKPALKENFLQIFIAPIFLFAEMVFAAGYRQDLQEEMKKYNL